MKAALPIALLPLVLCAPGTVSAADAPASGPADDGAEVTFRAAYESGTELYSKGRFGEALTHFEKAYAIRPAREVTFAKARCLHKMERFEEAAADYEKFLGTAPAEDAAKKARKHLTDVLLKVGHGKLAAGEPAAARSALARGIETHRDADPGLNTELAGDLLAALGDAHAALGETRDAIGAYERALLAVRGDDLRARLESSLAVLRAAASEADTPPVVADPVDGKSGSRPWALPVTTGVLTVAGAATGATLLILSQRALNASGSHKAYFASADARRRELHAGWGLVIAAGALGVTTIVATSVIAVSGGSPRPGPAPAVGIGPGAFSLTWKF